MNQGKQKVIPWILILGILLMATGCALPDPDLYTGATSPVIERSSHYSTMEEVALYLHLFGELPGNYLTKNEAVERGWVASQGNLWEVAEGMSIGGDRFGNREGRLPAEEGRHYYECDINYQGGFRGGERIVYSNDGLIFYSPDHYESFTLLYGEE